MLLNVMLVDDEPLALRSMEKLLKEFAHIKVIGSYQNPCEALDAAIRDKPDLVFLDIEMPVMEGMEAAERLLQIDPNVKIVFVTAYNDYAVDAFELHAFDYVLKPVRKDRIVKTLQRIGETKTVSPALDKPKESVIIRLFHTLQIELAGEPSVSIQWRTQKSQELFAYLLHRSGQVVRKDSLVDTLWPDHDPEKVYTNLYTTVYQLRKTLQRLDLGINIISSEEGYALERENIQVDVEAWEMFITDDLPVSEMTIHRHRQAMAWNRGQYLAKYDYAWAENKRHQLNNQWLHQAILISNHLMEIQAYSEAITLCNEMVERFPYAGHSYFTLMKIFSILGDRAGVEAQFQRLSDVLLDELGELPEPHIKSWYHEWKQTIN